MERGGHAGAALLAGAVACRSREAEVHHYHPPLPPASPNIQSSQNILKICISSGYGSIH